MYMNSDQMYPEVDLINWEQYPDYIKEDVSKNEEWYIYQFGYLRKYLNKVIAGWSVKDFFGGIPADRIAVYSITVFTGILIDDLRRYTTKKIFVSDKKIESELDNGIQHVLPAQMLFEKYQKGEINKVIVCGMFHENMIMEELIKIGFSLEDIITLSTILYFS